MDGYLAEYMPILIFLAIAVALAVIIVVASLVVAPQRPTVRSCPPTSAVSSHFKIRAAASTSR